MPTREPSPHPDAAVVETLYLDRHGRQTDDSDQAVERIMRHLDEHGDLVGTERARGPAWGSADDESDEPEGA